MLIQDFSFIIGDTQPVSATVDGSLVGKTVNWFLKNSVDDDDNTFILKKSTVNGSITVNSPSFSFVLSAVETGALSPNIVYYHEAKVIDGQGVVTTAFGGTAKAVNGYTSPSYATVEYADMYFDNVLFPEPWTTSDATTKTKALREATKKIDALMLIGRRVNADQAQEFPRSIYNSGLGCWVDESAVARCVVDATCEEALALMRGGTEANKRAELQRQGVTSFSLGRLSESYSGTSSSGNKLQSPTAAQLLSRYVGGSRAIG